MLWESLDSQDPSKFNGWDFKDLKFWDGQGIADSSDLPFLSSPNTTLIAQSERFRIYSGLADAGSVTLKPFTLLEHEDETPAPSLKWIPSKDLLTLENYQLSPNDTPST